ncbi:MAG: hypothetical protein LBD76_01870 [Prevotellaceae bacterium]|nr:hypothetical protein [Prevotellaceae bacterium]
MKIQNKIIFAMFAVMTLSTGVAQNSYLENNYSVENRYPHLKKNYTIATNPLYFFTGGMRFDLEKRIKNTPAWVQIGLTGHLLSREKGYYNNWYLISGDEMNYLLGGGLDLNYKRFLNRKESFYFAGGCSYSHYNIEYAGRYLRSYTEDALVYYTYEYSNIKQKIDKLGLSAFIGYQSPRPTFLFDIFAGIGYRYSFRKNKHAESFNNSMLSFGYRGYVFVAGIRFGIKLD